MRTTAQLKYGCQFCPVSRLLHASLMLSNVDSSPFFFEEVQLGMA